jgi:2-polyprenyl-6-methoxyphenol hydroxylase-like FAD-dependent oxidoreductase
MNNHYQVLIVGAGPVGLLLACKLKKSGINVVIVEKRSIRSTHSKALSMNAASLAILHSLGIVERFEQVGKKISDISIHWNKKRISHVNYRHLASRYQHILAIPQPETERLLEEYFIELGGEIRRSVTLSDIKVSASGINASLDNGASIECDYLIGCDGSHSSVRDYAGIQFTGFDYDMDFYLFDAEVEWEGRTDEVHYFVEEYGFIIMIPLADGNYRFVVRSRFEEETKPSLADYQSILSQYLPQALVIKSVIWESKSKFYNRLASRYRAGNIFLAGDACHLFSPIGGLGMNTGFQDAWNLAWKLIAVIREGEPVKLLNTYDEERRKIALLLRDSTDASTRLISRIDQDIKNIRGWLPIFSNRKRFRNLYPQVFSGLSQNYQGSSMIVEGGDFVGKYIPYFTLDDNNKKASSYDIVDGENYCLIINCVNSCRQYTNIVNNYELKVFLINDNDAQGENVLVKDEYILIRPDGIVAIHNKLHALNAIAHYFEINKTRTLK